MDENLYLFNSPRDTKICQRVAYPITERDSKVEKTIAKEFECPVCLNFSSPPIMMCINSHIICFECWRRCTNCPTCRATKTLTRAFALEKIHPLISFPCKWDGCPFIASASYTGVHEHFCKYFPLRCPFADSHECSWTGTMANVQPHLTDCHRDNVYFQPSVILKSRCFTKSAKRNYTIIFMVNDRLFKFYWSYDTSVSPNVRFGMVWIGNGNPVIVYNYTVVFSRGFPINGHCRKLKLIKCQVKKASTDCSVMTLDPSSGSTRTINHEQDFADLATFCIGGDLMYQVIIEVSHLAKYNKLNNRLSY